MNQGNSKNTYGWSFYYYYSLSPRKVTPLDF